MCSSPRVRVSSSATTGPAGVAPSVFAEFGAGLASDYRGTIERFLALETLGSDHARNELRALKTQVFARGEPALSALSEGLRVLDAADFRARDCAHFDPESLDRGDVATRLVHAAAMRWAAEHCDGRYVECNSGHAPFLGHAESLAATIGEFAEGLRP